MPNLYPGLCAINFNDIGNYTESAVIKVVADLIVSKEPGEEVIIVISGPVLVEQDESLSSLISDLQKKCLIVTLLIDGHHKQSIIPAFKKVDGLVISHDVSLYDALDEKSGLVDMIAAEDLMGSVLPDVAVTVCDVVSYIEMRNEFNIMLKKAA